MDEQRLDDIPEGGARRFRNAAAAVAGAVAVAAIIATPALLAQGNESAGPGPGPGVETPDASDAPDSVVPTPVSPDRIKVRAAEIHYRFPLAVGWPDDRSATTEELGREGPDRSLDSLRFNGCGTSFDEPAYLDRLRADWTDLEDVRHRQLTTYADAKQAQAAVDRLDEFFESCPTEDFDDGYVRVGQMVETDQGDQSWALVRQFERGGSSVPGIEIVSVVRVGRAVFVDTVSNDTVGGAGTRGSVQAQLDTMAAASAEPVATMCVFSEDGCPSGAPFSNRRRRP